MDQPSPDTETASRPPNQSAEEYLYRLLTQEQKEYLETRPEDRAHLIKHPEDIRFLEEICREMHQKPLPMPPEMMERLNDAVEGIRLRRQLEEYNKKNG